MHAAVAHVVTAIADQAVMSRARRVEELARAPANMEAL
jgi:hypothetical protein